MTEIAVSLCSMYTHWIWMHSYSLFFVLFHRGHTSLFFALSLDMNINCRHSIFFNILFFWWYWSNCHWGEMNGSCTIKKTFFFIKCKISCPVVLPTRNRLFFFRGSLIFCIMEDCDNVFELNVYSLVHLLWIVSTYTCSVDKNKLIFTVVSKTIKVIRSFDNELDVILQWK